MTRADTHIRFLIIYGVFVFVTAMFFGGCIRLSGEAGYWHQGPNDEVPKSKTVGFDTQNMVPGSNPPGKIDFAD